MNSTIDEARIKEFLDGEGKYNQLQHVRYIDVPNWDNKGTIVIRDPNCKISHKQIPYEPFVWSKPIDFNVHFVTKTIEAKQSDYTDKVVQHNGKLYHLGEEAEFLGVSPSSSMGMFSIKLNTLEERKEYFLQKKREYNIIEKSLTTSFDEVVPRMENGYKVLFQISPFPSDPQNPHRVNASSNPKFRYKQNGNLNAITGSFNNLMDFLKEGQIDAYERSGTFLNTKQIQELFTNGKLSDKIFFWLSTVTPFKNKIGYLDLYKQLWRPTSFNADKCIEWIKKSKKYSAKIESHYEPTEIVFESRKIDFGDIKTKIIYQDHPLYLGDSEILWVTPTPIPLHNVLGFMGGYEALGSNFDKIKSLIGEEVVELCTNIKKYAPKKVIFDTYKVWGEHKEAIMSLIADEMRNEHKNTLYYSYVDEDGETIETDIEIAPDDIKAPKSITKTRIFEYFDIFDFKGFLKDLYADGVLEDIFNPEINFDFLTEYEKEAEKKSLHTNKYGRIFSEQNPTYITQIWGQIQLVPPISQFMYQTGIRLFRGYEFSDIRRLTFDIETKALPSSIDNPQAALSATTGQIFKIGLRGSWGYSRILSSDNPKDERAIIEESYRIIAQENPDILLGYNSESFDFPFMEKRLEILGGVAEDRDGVFSVHQHIRNIISEVLPLHYPDLYLSGLSFYKKKKSNVKAGGENKETPQTYIWGINVMDGIHQTWRMMAINKQIEFAGLKYNITTNKIGKPNRVYIRGNDIGKIEDETKKIYLDDSNGHWFINEIPVDFEKTFYDGKQIKTNEDGELFYGHLDRLYIYTNDSKEDSIISKCKNAFEINVLDSIGQPIGDDCYDSYCSYLDARYEELESIIDNYTGIVVPHKRNGITLSPMNQGYFKKKFYDFHANCKNLIQLVPNKENYQEVDGKYIVHRYLEDDLWETDVLFEKYVQSSFMLSAWTHNNFDRVSLMGNAVIWKVIISCWHYNESLGIPEFDAPREINGGLIGMVLSGFCERVCKFDYSSLYPAIKNAYIPKPCWDISGVSDGLLQFFLYTRLDYKALSNENFEAGNAELGSKYKALQEPLKIFINSYFGFLSAAFVSPFADMLTGQFITAASRGVARHKNRHMEKRGYKVCYMHTDGLNFIFPSDVETRIYVGKGINWLVEYGKIYTGLKADVAEYNDTFFPIGKMGVGIDGVDISCINIAKSNVVHYKEKKKGDALIRVVDITGGLVKKDTPEYIKGFVETATPILMEGNGSGFIDAYYAHINKIWNYGIKAKDIASKVKLKSIQTYIDNSKVKSAPYELIMRDKIDVTPGNYFYWVNSGLNQGDTDFSIEKTNVGYFVGAHPNLKTLVNKKDFLGLSTYIGESHSNGTFVFSRSRQNGKLEANVGLLEDFSNAYAVEVKSSIKNINKVPMETISVELQMERFNIKHVPVQDYDATIQYNRKKYLAKFNSAIEPLFIVFAPETRKTVIQHDTDEKFIKPILRKADMKLINGIPLEGKEHNQQDLESLMRVQPIERKFWEDIRCDPNWVLTGRKIDKMVYWVKDNELLETQPIAFDAKLTPTGAIRYLCENPIDAPPINHPSGQL